MYRLTAVVPLVWGALLGSAIAEDTNISIGLFVAGIIGTVVFVWRARGEYAKLKGRLHDLEEWRGRQEKKK